MTPDTSEAGSDRDPPSVAIVMSVVVVVLFAVVGFQLFQVAASEDVKEFAERSTEWCEERNGSLANENVIGEHGGLHCHLPNGTSVHMDEVITDVG